VGEIVNAPLSELSMMNVAPLPQTEVSVIVKAPVAPDVEVAEPEFLALATLDTLHSFNDLLGDEALGAQR